MPAAAGRIDPAKADEIARRIRKLNGISFLFGVPGLLLQSYGNMMRGAGGPGAVTGAPIMLLGTALLIVGLTFYARMRGQSPWFGLVGLLSCIGLIILVVLPKKCLGCGQTVKGAVCAACGAPAPK
jgi:hypothetical protein